MPTQKHQAVTLLQLPGPCLTQVLQCLATSHPASLLSAARAHSTLHQAAVLALSSITADVGSQQQLDSLLLYLDKHGQRVSGIELSVGDGHCSVDLRRLPLSMQLSSMQLDGLRLQLRPGKQGCYRGVLGASKMPLTHLQLCDCRLVDGAAGLAAALAQLPGLLHLSCQDLYPGYVSCSRRPYHVEPLTFPTGALRRLQQLTFLQLSGVNLPGGIVVVFDHDDTDGTESDTGSDAGSGDGGACVGAGVVDAAAADGGDAGVFVVDGVDAGGIVDVDAVDDAGSAGGDGADATGPAQQQPLQPLEALTQLVHLQLDLTNLRCRDDVTLTAGMLAGACRLTALVLLGLPVLDPAVLQGKSLLQHLQLDHCGVGRTAGKAQLLSLIQPLSQLTCLELPGTLWCWDSAPPPAAAYAALTASSVLQQLNISSCSLPVGAWEQLFAPGRQLPELQALDVSCVHQPGSAFETSSAFDPAGPAPDGSLMVSCCPNLRTLDMQKLRYTTALLAPLTGLTRLQSLRLSGQAETLEQLRPLAPPPAVVRPLLGLTGLEWGWEWTAQAGFG